MLLLPPLSSILNKSQADNAHVIARLVLVNLASKHVGTSSILLVTVGNSDSAIQRGLINFTFAIVQGIFMCKMSIFLVPKLF